MYGWMDSLLLSSPWVIWLVVAASEMAIELLRIGGIIILLFRCSSCSRSMILLISESSIWQEKKREERRDRRLHHHEGRSSSHIGHRRIKAYIGHRRIKAYIGHRRIKAYLESSGWVQAPEVPSLDCWCLLQTQMDQCIGRGGGSVYRQVGEVDQCIER